MPHKKRKYSTRCSYSDQICFTEIFFGNCHWQHSQQNIQQMKQQWGNIKHDQRRNLQSKQKQPQLICKSGINCYYLLKGNCTNGHPSFDLQWAINTRKILYQIECPVFECENKHCYYHHTGKGDQSFQKVLQKMRDHLHTVQIKQKTKAQK